MRYIDICSGISAPTMAWKPLGWEALCFAEIEAAPRSVLTHHYPDVPLRGDFTEIEGTEYGPVDLLVGGTPCQDFSVAGLRAGLGGERGNLSLQYLRLADRARPRWLVWENVPGVLSIDGGRAFGAILGGMVELGYGIAYRVLDAQFFGVPQRRRRVFVVGYLGDWRRAAAVLFERHSLQGNPPPRRQAREDVARSIRAQPQSSHREDSDNFVAVGSTDVARTLMAKHTRHDPELESYAIAFAHQQGGNMDLHHANDLALALQRCQGQAIAFTAKDHGADAGEIAPTLRAGGHSGSHANAGVMPAVAFAIQERAVSENLENGPGGKGFAAETAYTLEARNKVQAVAASAVRRLTPRECERLQGFPDDFTLVPHRGKPMADGPRYKMLGNSMAVPVVRWIGERIEMVEAIGKAKDLAA